MGRPRQVRLGGVVSYLRSMAATENQKDLAEFDEWITELFGAGPTRERIRLMLVDAFWKGQMDDTEIVRAFRLNQHGHQMIPELGGKDLGRR
jgi:hypothetical protein